MAAFDLDAIKASHLGGGLLQSQCLICRLIAEVERLRELLRDVATCGYDPASPPGIDWVTVQVDIPTWDALGEFR